MTYLKSSSCKLNINSYLNKHTNPNRVWVNSGQLIVSSRCGSSSSSCGNCAFRSGSCGGAPRRSVGVGYCVDRRNNIVCGVMKELKI